MDLSKNAVLFSDETAELIMKELREAETMRDVDRVLTERGPLPDFKNTIPCVIQWSSVIE